MITRTISQNLYQRTFFKPKWQIINQITRQNVSVLELANVENCQKRAVRYDQRLCLDILIRRIKFAGWSFLVLSFLGFGSFPVQGLIFLSPNWNTRDIVKPKRNWPLAQLLLVYGRKSFSISPPVLVRVIVNTCPPVSCFIAYIDTWEIARIDTP